MFTLCSNLYIRTLSAIFETTIVPLYIKTSQPIITVLLILGISDSLFFTSPVTTIFLS